MAFESMGEQAWRMAFQLSPIILSGGLAPSFLSGYLPIIAITELINFPAGLLSGMQIGTDGFFANFRPLPGTTILEQDVGHYPFANQGVAANAVISMPRQIIMEMTAPAKTDLGFWEKLAVMEALEAALDVHTQQGGTYLVITPSKIYQNCLLKAIRDVSGQARTNQPQVVWQWEFEQPLLTADDLGGVLNSLYDWISRQTQAPDPALNAGIQTTTSTPQSLATGQGMPAAAPASGTAVPSNSLPPTSPVRIQSVTVPATPPTNTLPPFQIPGMPGR